MRASSSIVTLVLSMSPYMLAGCDGRLARSSDDAGLGSVDAGADALDGATSDEALCGYGLGQGGRTWSLRVVDPLAELLTAADRPDTAEVYCVLRQGAGTRSMVMVPGRGLSQYIFLTTPDRRAGWASLASSAGITAHVLNPLRNRTYVGDPNALSTWAAWSEDDFWSAWGFGPMPREAYADVRFPVAQADDFIAHLPLETPGPGGTTATPEAIDEIVELLDEVGPTVLVFHSAGGPAAFEAARRRPERILGLVAIEPTGCPEVAEEVPAAPFLAVYGDYVAARGQSGRLASCRTTRDLAIASGAPAEVLYYPELGVHGNTHLLVQDDNNALIFGDVLGWLEENVWP